jgi:hypothetical protein
MFGLEISIRQFGYTSVFDFTIPLLTTVLLMVIGIFIIILTRVYGKLNHKNFTIALVMLLIYTSLIILLYVIWMDIRVLYLEDIIYEPQSFWSTRMLNLGVLLPFFGILSGLFGVSVGVKEIPKSKI